MVGWAAEGFFAASLRNEVLAVFLFFLFFFSSRNLNTLKHQILTGSNVGLCAVVIVK